MRKRGQKHSDDKFIITKYVLRVIEEGHTDQKRPIMALIPEDLKKVIDYFKDCGNRNYEVCLVGEKESVRKDLKIEKGKEFIHLDTQSLNDTYSFLPIGVKNSIRRINKLVGNPDNEFNKTNLGIHTLGLVPISEINSLNDSGFGLASWNSIGVYSAFTDDVNTVEDAVQNPSIF